MLKIMKLNYAKMGTYRLYPNKLDMPPAFFIIGIIKYNTFIQIDGTNNIFIPGTNTNILVDK